MLENPVAVCDAPGVKEDDVDEEDMKPSVEATVRDGVSLGIRVRPKLS